MNVNLYSVPTTIRTESISTRTEPISWVSATQQRRIARMRDDAIERRRFLRWPVFWQASLTDSEQYENCLVLDFSPGGAKVRAVSAASFGPLVSLGFPGTIGLFGKLAWQHGQLMGIEFRQDAQQCAELMQDVLAERAQAG